MKKFLFIKVVVLLCILFILVSCKGLLSKEDIKYEKEAVYGNSEFTTNYTVVEKEETSIAVSESLKSEGIITGIIKKVGDSVITKEETLTVFEEIAEEKNNNNLTDLEYSKLIIDAAFYPDEVKEEYGNTIYNNTKVDISNSLQIMVDNFDEISKSEQEKVRKVLFADEKREIKSFSDYFIRKVYAEDVSITTEVQNSIYTFMINSEFALDHSEDINLFIDRSVETYELLSFKKPGFVIILNFVSLPICTDSYSTYVPMQTTNFNGPELNDVFNIFIDMNIGAENIEAAIYHEMFHAYQYNSGLTSTSDEANWLKEATAIWAIDQVDANFDFEHRYISPMYSNLMIGESYSFTNDTYSWYQLFQYFTEDIKSYNEKYMYEIITEFAINGSLDKTFLKVHQDRIFINQDFAKFGMTVFNNEHSDEGFKTIDPYYPDIGPMLEEENYLSFEDLSEDYGSEWQTTFVDTAGIKPMIIKIPSSFKSQFNVMVNIPATREAKKSGIVVGKYDGIEWKFDVTEELIEKTNYVYDCSKETIEAIVLLMYSTDFNDACEVEYRLSQGMPEEAHGTIKYTINRDMTKGDTNMIYNDSSVYTITEELYKYQTDSNAPDMLAFQRSMMGDSYFVDNMTIDFKYTSKYKEGDVKEDITGDGFFNYDGTDVGGGLFGSLPNLSENGGLATDAPTSSGGVMDIIGGLIGGGDGEDSGGGLLESIGGMLGMDTLGQLKRFTIKPEMNSFEIIPSLPSNISDHWVDYTKIDEWKDSYGDTKKKTTEYTNSAGDLFPVWFINPKYDPKAGSEEAQDAENSSKMTPEEWANMFDESKEYFNEVLSMNDKFNRFNINQLIEDPYTNQGLDLKDFISSIESGEQYEKASFTGSVFKGEINVSFYSKSGYYVTIKVEYNYEFK